MISSQSKGKTKKNLDEHRETLAGLSSEQASLRDS
jgi:hypothetical protein